jgi:flagellar assembly protein FliH
LAQLLAGDLEELRQKARDQGLAEGRAAGLTKVAAEAASSLEALAAVVSGSDAALKEQRDQLAEQCAEIVAAALTRIAGPMLSTRKAAIGAVLEVLKRLTEETQLTIRVSASDLPALREVEDRLAAVLAGREYALVADTRVEAGGAIVESPLGSLDGRLEVQLRGLADTVLAAKASRRKQP